MCHLWVEISLLRKIEELCHTAALGMNQKLRVTMLFQFLVHNLRSNPSMNMAFPGPNLHIASRPLLHKRSQKQVWKEEDLPVPRNTIHNFDRVAGGADIITLGFHLSSGIDVRDNYGVRMLA